MKTQSKSNLKLLEILAEILADLGGSAGGYLVRSHRGEEESGGEAKNRTSGRSRRCRLRVMTARNAITTRWRNFGEDVRALEVGEMGVEEMGVIGEWRRA